MPSFGRSRRRGAAGASTEPDLERQVQRLRKRLRRATRELDELRAFTLAVFPDLEVPAPVVATVDAVRAEELTYLTRDQLLSLVTCVLECEQAGREGLLIEAGTARGGASIAMAAAKSPSRPLRVYDVFGLIPPPTEADGEQAAQRYADIQAGQGRRQPGKEYYGYADDLHAEVAESFARHGVATDEHRVELVQGLFQDTLVIDEPVALAHLDGDWYESTLVCLERITPHLVVGGRIVIDDYHFWAGCRRAVDEYFEGRRGFRVEKRAKVHVVRTAEG